MENEINQILTRMKPKNDNKTPPQTNPSVNKNTNIIINKTSNRSVLVFIIAISILSCTLIYHFANIRPSFSYQSYSPQLFLKNQIISDEQADEIKSLVNQVSIKEGKHINTVHNELKRMFNYSRYRGITSDTFEKVKQVLQNRLRQ